MEADLEFVAVDEGERELIMTYVSSVSKNKAFN